MSLLDHSPKFDELTVREFADSRYGIFASEIRPLVSERDQNFLLASDNQHSCVFKISASNEDREFLRAQNQILDHLQSGIDWCPTVIPGIDGQLIQVLNSNGAGHHVRLLSWIQGDLLGEHRFHSNDLLVEIGDRLGSLDQLLESFDHPALHRDFLWDLQNCLPVIEQRIGLITESAKRANIQRFVDLFQINTVPLLSDLPKSVIHNDANDHNILVVPGEQFGAWNFSGLIDFGDAVYSWTVAELAIAIAYLILDKPDPLQTACHVIKGYHRQRALSELEIEALYGLITMRLCVSAVIAAENLQSRPDDEYLDVSQASIDRILPRLASIPYEYSTARFRSACGLAPVAKHRSVCNWLKQHRGDFHFPIASPLNAEFKVLDLGVDSPMLAEANWPLTEPQITRLVDRELEGGETTIGVGHYLEPRLLYASDQFAGSNLEEEKRTVHLGIDLFANAGVKVVGPIEGTVYYVGTIDRPLDYGTMVILEHRTDQLESYFTLYGHLARKSLDAVRVGQPVDRGTTIGWLGNPIENGGWTPHLHFQLILDLLGFEHEFPGVGHASIIDVWSSVSPDPNLILDLPATLVARETQSKSQTLRRRHRLLGKALSLGYDQPLKIVRGIGAYLFDETGRQFVDAYNNVPHVGHCHPEVVDAAWRQMNLLNTNTRYLNEVVTDFAEQLTQTMPDSLEVCYFLNSATEANELAIRLARNFTRSKNMIVLEGAYHGNSTSLIDMSPYKHDGPGGQGPADWVHSVPNADIYRGPHRDPESAGSAYAEDVIGLIRQLNSQNQNLCGFIAESCPSVGGQILFPAGYLQQVYQAVRAAGGVCIADDVQTGYGRLGSAFYGFELQGVVPDIVVLGKPMGNGHPLAAVVTTREISDAFNNGMEFFSTFGGNTVSCAVGLKVLEIVRRDNLQQHAYDVGNQLLSEFQRLQRQYPIIGDIRGSGFFLGIELVRDPNTLEPADDEARFVVNRMRDRNVLVGTDGPLHNVIKVRPPMVFTDNNAQHLLDALSKSLGELR